MVHLLLHRFLRGIDAHAGNALLPQGVQDVLHTGKAHGHLSPQVAVPVEIQQLFLKGGVLKVEGGPVDLRAVDAGALQHPV